jgi:hypothetical protein
MAVVVCGASAAMASRDAIDGVVTSGRLREEPRRRKGNRIAGQMCRRNVNLAFRLSLRLL